MLLTVKYLATKAFEPPEEGQLSLESYDDTAGSVFRHIVTSWGYAVEDCKFSRSASNMPGFLFPSEASWYSIDHITEGWVGEFKVTALLYKQVEDGNCPKCGNPTRFVRTALICPTHGVVGGF